MSDEGQDRDPLLADLIGGLEAPQTRAGFFEALMARVADTSQEGSDAPLWRRERREIAPTLMSRAEVLSRRPRPRPSRDVLEARYPTLVPVFTAIGWKTWADIGIDPEEHPLIGELGRVTVLDRSAGKSATLRSELHFAQHSDFPDLPLVVKFARRGETRTGRRLPSYWDTRTERPADIPVHSSEALAFEEPAYHLANEIEFAEMVSGFPYIVPPVDSGHAGLIAGRWHAYVVYPYFPNGDLEEFLDGAHETDRGFGRSGHRRMLPQADFHEVVRSLHVAMTALWVSAQQRHGDIKPGNLLVDGRGGVWLTDFEVASAQGTVTTRDRRTPAFCAPEVLSPGAAPANRFVRAVAADAYSVGAVLYTLAAGAYPHWAEVRKHGPEQRVEDWELALARAGDPPAPPVGMAAEAWVELRALLSPDPYERVGLDKVSGRRLAGLAGLPVPAPETGLEDILRRVEQVHPDLLQRTLAQHCLDTMSRFLAAEERGGAWPGSEGGGMATAGLPRDRD